MARRFLLFCLLWEWQKNNCVGSVSRVCPVLRRSIILHVVLHVSECEQCVVIPSFVRPLSTEATQPHIHSYCILCWNGMYRRAACWPFVLRLGVIQHRMRSPYSRQTLKSVFNNGFWGLRQQVPFYYFPDIFFFLFEEFTIFGIHKHFWNYFSFL